MQPLRILIIDNAISHTKVMRAAMEEILAALPGGGTVALATTAEETQQLLASFAPNAITINYAMSILRIDDSPFVSWLVQTAGAPIIAYGLSAVLRETALASGIDAYFLRPTHRNDWPPFCSKIARFLRRLAFPDEPPIYAYPRTQTETAQRTLFHTPVPPAAAQQAAPTRAVPAQTGQAEPPTAAGSAPDGQAAPSVAGPVPDRQTTPPAAAPSQIDQTASPAVATARIAQPIPPVANSVRDGQPAAAPAGASSPQADTPPLSWARLFPARSKEQTGAVAAREAAAPPAREAPPQTGKPGPAHAAQTAAVQENTEQKAARRIFPAARADEPLVRAQVPSSLRRERTPSKDDQIFALLARTAARTAPPPRASVPDGELLARVRPVSGIALIAIGASTGGTDAIADVLHQLRPPLPPIVIVQHIPAYFSRLFAIRLNEECVLPVEEGEDGLTLEPGHAYIAPGDQHMAVCRQGGALALHCFTGPKLHSVRPAVDVLFASVVKTVGCRALGVLLTGMGKDGAAGLLHLRKAGAPTIGQDRESCVVYGMPRVAQESGAVLYQLPLGQIAPAIQKIIRGRY